MFDTLTEIDQLTKTLRDAGELDPEQAQHTVIRVIHGLCQALLRAERRGVRAASVTASLEPARLLHAQSAFLQRLQTWPRGYPGDFETIEMICDGEVVSQGALARSLEWYALNSPVAQQHMNKLERQTELLASVCSEKAAPSILIVGCGGCRDFHELPRPASGRAGRVTLNDIDSAALELALGRVRATGLEVSAEAGNALRVVPRLARRERYDLIIAGGIFDYLPDSAATLLLRHAFQALLPGGLLFFTNIADKNPYRPWLEHVLNWKLIERTRSELDELIDAAGIAPAAVRSYRERTGLTHLIELRAPSER